MLHVGIWLCFSIVKPFEAVEIQLASNHVSGLKAGSSLNRCKIICSKIKFKSSFFYSFDHTFILRFTPLIKYNGHFLIIAVCNAGGDLTAETEREALCGANGNSWVPSCNIVPCVHVNGVAYYSDARVQYQATEVVPQTIAFRQVVTFKLTGS